MVKIVVEIICVYVELLALVKGIKVLQLMKQISKEGFEIYCKKNRIYTGQHQTIWKEKNKRGAFEQCMLQKTTEKKSYN